MATNPEHMDDSMTAPARAGKPSITASPAFPWIVALWLAALLGIGSMIVPVSLLERASVALGLPSILPMAAPPLGLKAQSLVALGGTLLGAALGLAIARRIAASRIPALADHSEGEWLDAPADLGESDIEPEVELLASTTRRRSLATAVDSDEVADSEVLPAARFPEVELVYEPVAPAAEPADDDVFELEAEAAVIDEEPVEEWHEPAESEPFLQVVDAEDSEPVEGDAIDAGDPLPFSPPSLARGEGDAVHLAEDDEIDPAQDAGPESEDSVYEKPDSEAATTASRESEADMADEGLVQLVQRLSATLDRHRRWSAERAAQKAAAPSPVSGAVAEPVARKTGDPSVPGDFDVAAAAEAARAKVAYFSPSAASLPTPVEDDAAQPAANEVEHVDAALVDLWSEHEDEDGADESAEFGDFASLNPFRRDPGKAVHPDRVESVVREAPSAPAQDGAAQQVARPKPSNDDHERVLREALMNLQRMGK
ncbi:hypothetical protein [Aurantiacibacter hainanensis]|uniref:hypothetical protein n=1 Tax=Aurantiacibacter hainanensis TaxID=3076114 RepID=UPI0030C68468